MSKPFGRLWTFDFDGVLVDSYTCIPEIYRQIGIRFGMDKHIDQFISSAIHLEDFYDGEAIYDRLVWWPDFFSQFKLSPIDFNELLRMFWESKIALSKIRSGVKPLLKLLKSSGMKLAIICGNDGQPGMKNHRIQKSGLAEMFDEILIIGETTESRKHAIDSLMTYVISPKNLVIVEDKPGPIKDYQKIDAGIITIRVNMQGPLSRAWLEYSWPDYSFDSIEDLLNMLCSI